MDVVENEGEEETELTVGESDGGAEAVGGGVFVCMYVTCVRLVTGDTNNRQTHRRIAERVR